MRDGAYACANLCTTRPPRISSVSVDSAERGQVCSSDHSRRRETAVAVMDEEGMGEAEWPYLGLAPAKRLDGKSWREKGHL